MGTVNGLAQLIQQQEGWAPGTRSYRNNNPGNLWDGSGTIFGLPTDAQGFVIFPSAAAGMAALQQDIQANVNQGQTLTSFLTKYAPPSQNDTQSYINSVASQLGVDPNIPLSQSLGNTVAMATQGGGTILDNLTGGLGVSVDWTDPTTLATAAIGAAVVGMVIAQLV